ncbi:MAG: hypothetical protein P8178_18350 [Candidatus Thiodiazotropha sp.]
MRQRSEMVDIIRQIGRVMGLKTFAEYDEDTAIVERLIEKGIGYAQGFGPHKPIAARVVLDARLTMT